jgi:CheY-like chemotaxis protein
MKPVHILLVEDDELDVEAFQRVLKKNNISTPVTTAVNGADALDRLNGANGKDKVPQPCLMLVDINMPRMSGLQLLEEIRNSDDLKTNIVFMLTTSNRREDKDSAYKLNAAGYFLKENLRELPSLLTNYITINEFPAVHA